MGVSSGCCDAFASGSQQSGEPPAQASEDSVKIGDPLFFQEDLVRSLRTQVRCLELGSGDPQTIEVLNRMVVSAENTLESCRALGALQDAIECYFQDHSDTLGVRDV